MPQDNGKPTVFISYCQKDKEWLNSLLPHLETLEQQNLIKLWHDGMIDKGADWHPAIKAAVAEASVAVCLVTANFLASDFIMKEEIPALLDRRQKAGMLLLPILARPCPWKAVRWLRNIQLFPDPKCPLEALESDVEREQALADIATHIYDRIADPGFTIPPPTVKWPALAPEFVETARLPATGAEVFGRADEFALLDEAWDLDTTHIVSFVAWGGVGKSALVNKWVAGMAKDHYRGAERVYAWSFYSQGTHQYAASSDDFIDKALRWFGDEATANSTRSAWDKGRRLAELVRQHRTLLVLDGLEPLQSGYGHNRGEITDPAVAALIRDLARDNPGLCAISTRVALPGLERYAAHVEQRDLEQISDDAGRALLRVSGIKGTDAELQKMTRDFGNHALAINLLATYLRGMDGDPVVNAALIPDLDIPDDEGRHPRRVMERYARLFDGKCELEILHMLGLFDRPASAKEINYLRTTRTIPHLSEQSRFTTERGWEQALAKLREARLIAPEHPHTDATPGLPPNRRLATVGSSSTSTEGPGQKATLLEQDHGRPGGRPYPLDCHPLVREHFGERLKSIDPDAWRQGHSALYDYLAGSTPRFPNTLSEMQPLVQAVAHGCRAGRHQEVFDSVYRRRIDRGNEWYSTTKLGMFGADLAAVSGFFEEPWHRPVDELKEDDRAFLLNEAGVLLRALGRLADAVEPMTAGLDMASQAKDWKNAAQVASNVSELWLTLGDVGQTLDYAGQSVNYADRSGDTFCRMTFRTTLADALHQAGQFNDAERHFIEAETMQQELQPPYPFLYSLQGYQYCDLLLQQGRFDDVIERGAQTLKWASQRHLLLDVALDHLSLGRAHALADGDGHAAKAVQHLNAAVDGLRQAGSLAHVPRGLVARAAWYRVCGEYDAAHRDLDEAFEIAERGQMRLYEADIRLEYARLYFELHRTPTAEVGVDIKRRVDEVCEACAAPPPNKLEGATHGGRLSVSCDSPGTPPPNEIGAPPRKKGTDASGASLRAQTGVSLSCLRQSLSNGAGATRGHGSKMVCEACGSPPPDKSDGAARRHRAARHELATAKAMIAEMGYHRRDAEVQALENELTKEA